MFDSRAQRSSLLSMTVVGLAILTISAALVTPAGIAYAPTEAHFAVPDLMRSAPGVPNTTRGTAGGRGSDFSLGGTHNTTGSPDAGLAPPAWIPSFPGCGCEGVNASNLVWDTYLGADIFVGGETSNGVYPQQTASTLNNQATDWGVSGDGGMSGRADAAAAYYPPLEGIVLFGGHNSTALSDTWVYNYWGDSLPPPLNGSVDWRLANVTGPSARWGAAMAYDPDLNALILFGGTNGTGALDDTWEFVNTTWTQLSPSVSPSPRWGATFAWDAASDELVLFGGYGASGQAGLSDTWTFSAAGWSQVHPTTSPPGVYGASSLAQTAERIMLVGGANGTGALSDQTWIFESGNWTRTETQENYQAGLGMAFALAPDGIPMEMAGCLGSSVVGCGTIGGLAFFDNLTVQVTRGQGSVALSRVVNEVGTELDLTSHATQGWGTVSYQWRLPNGTVVNGTVVNATSSTLGNLTYTAIVSDSSVATSTSVVVETVVLPSVAFVGGTTQSTDVGAETPLSVRASGGTGVYQYVWGGLPEYCPSVNASSLACVFESTGTVQVSLFIVDSLGYRASALNLTLTVVNDPQIVSLVASPSPATVGQSMTLTASLTGGVMPFEFAYQGLPPGCASTNASTVSCSPSASGNFTVNLTSTDATGWVDHRTVNLTVDPASTPASPAGLTTTEILALIGIVVVLASVAVFFSVRRRRSGGVQSKGSIRQPSTTSGPEDSSTADSERSRARQVKKAPSASVSTGSRTARGTWGGSIPFVDLSGRRPPRCEDWSSRTLDPI